jgi:muramidase (phage lysozyme)
MLSEEQLTASLQKITSSLFTNLYGAYNTFRHKYKKDQAKYDSKVNEQKVYVEEFSKSFLELMSLLKTLEQYPKVALDKEHLHWIEAYAGHIYQQFHDEYLPILKEKISVEDKAEFALQKKWEKTFWARAQASIKELASRFSIIKKDFPSIEVDSSHVLPKVSLARFLSLRNRFRRNLMIIAAGVLILIEAGCGSGKDGKNPPVVSTSKTLFSLMSGMRGEVQIGRITWNKFLYNGKIVAKRKKQWQQIADQFDEWDKAQGDKYKNVGWKNVKVDGKQVIVWAKPKKKGKSVKGPKVVTPRLNQLATEGAAIARGYQNVASVGTPEFRALLDTIAYVEAVDPGQMGYRRVVNGRVTSDRNGRLQRRGGRNYFTGWNGHPQIVVNWGGGYSRATGRYQVTGRTWGGLPRRLTRNIRPRTQDRIGIHLARGRGVTQRMLERAAASGDFTEIARHITQEWASIRNPATGRGAHANQRAGRGTLQTLNRVFQFTWRAQRRRNRGQM